MKKILFMGSKPIGYRTLHFLIEHKKDFDCEIVGVLSNDNQRFDTSLSVRKLAYTYAIPFVEELEKILDFTDIDIIISVQYHKILKKRHIEVAREIAINLHMAPLPEYRGCNQFSFAILNRDKEFGTTIHQLDEGVDSGPIIAERRFEIPEGIYVDELYELTFEASLSLFREKIGQIIAGNYSLTPQTDYFSTRKTSIHYRKEINELKTIPLDESIIRRIRATAMPGFEPPYALDKEKKIYLIPEDIYVQLKKN